ncbi:MAG: MATE family efflux transporter [Bacillota bacterium]|nr:MATE family efflux transporter [Bacillota bacterium]
MNLKIDKEFYKRLFSVAVPIALHGIITASLTLLDNLMVNQLGETQLASVGLATQCFSLEWLVIFGFCSGCATFYTQFWGIKDVRNIKKVIGIALMTCFCVGLVFFIAGFFFPVQVLNLFTDSPEAALLGAEYLKAASINFILVGLTQPIMYAMLSTEQTKIPLYVSMASFFVDLSFNYLLIFGKLGFPKLGLRGAAIATVLARFLEFVIAMILLFGKKNILSGKLSEYFSFNLEYAKRVYKNAIFTCMHETLWSLAMTAQTAAYGHMSISSFAAIQATATVMDIFQFAGYSIGDASLIFVGECLGRNEIEEAKATSKKLAKVCFTFGCILALIVIALRKPILSLFKLSDLGFYYARRLILVRCFYLPFYLLVVLMVSGVLRAGGDTRFAAITELSCMWLWLVPAAFFFGMYLQLPIYIVLLITNIEEIIKIIIVLVRYKSGKWLKNMIKGM